MKHRVVCLFIAVATAIGLATAQSSQVRSSSTKASPDPLKASTKPLTPKSPLAPGHKTPVAVTNTSKGGRNTTAELTHLERQNIKGSGSKSGSTGPAKGASVAKSADTSAAKGQGINFKYQKPVGGVQALTPGAHSANSGTPRVKKN